MTLDELNNALLWLAERQGTIQFSVDLMDRGSDAQAPTPTIEVTAMSVTDVEAGGGTEAKPCEGCAPISGGNVAGALLAAIKAAQSEGRKGAK